MADKDKREFVFVSKKNIPVFMDGRLVGCVKAQVTDEGVIMNGIMSHEKGIEKMDSILCCGVGGDVVQRDGRLITELELKEVSFVAAKKHSKEDIERLKKKHKDINVPDEDVKSDSFNEGLKDALRDCPKCKGNGWYFTDDWLCGLQGRRDCKCIKRKNK